MEAFSILCYTFSKLLTFSWRLYRSLKNVPLLWNRFNVSRFCFYFNKTFFYYSSSSDIEEVKSHFLALNPPLNLWPENVKFDFLNDENFIRVCGGKFEIIIIFAKHFGPFFFAFVRTNNPSYTDFKNIFVVWLLMWKKSKKGPFK